MANTQTSTERIVLMAAFADEDDRSLSIENPKPGLTEQQIHALEPAAAKILIGDKYQAKFTRFKSARYETSIKTKLDLG